MLRDSYSTTYESVAPRVGPLLGLVDLLEPLPAGDSGGRAHVVDLEGLEVDLLLVQLLLNLRVVVMGDEVGNDVEDFEGQVGQVFEHHGALEGGAARRNPGLEMIQLDSRSKLAI